MPTGRHSHLFVCTQPVHLPPPGNDDDDTDDDHGDDDRHHYDDDCGLMVNLYLYNGGASGEKGHN